MNCKPVEFNGSTYLIIAAKDSPIFISVERFIELLQQAQSLSPNQTPSEEGLYDSRVIGLAVDLLVNQLFEVKNHAD